MRLHATLFEQLLRPGDQIDLNRFWQVAHELRPPMGQPGSCTYGDLLAALYNREGKSIATLSQVARQWGWSYGRIWQMRLGAIAALRNPECQKRFVYRQSPDELTSLEWLDELVVPDTWETRFEQGIASLEKLGLSVRARNNLTRHYAKQGREFRDRGLVNGRLLEFDEWIEQVQSGKIDLRTAGWYSFGEKTNQELLETIERRNAAMNQT
jgi:hypothetical protein